MMIDREETKMKQLNMFELDMFEALSEAMFKFASDKEWSIEMLSDIVSKRHVGDGYFSYDGMLDDVAALIGEDLASEVVGCC